jgi:hypothetical protein
MALAVRNIVLATLVTELKAITKANGYSLDVQTVARVNPNEVLVDAAKQPAIFLWCGPETKFLVDVASPMAPLAAPAGAQQNACELNVIFLCRVASDQEQVGIEFAADIEKVLVTPNGRVLAGTMLDITAQGNLILNGVPDDTRAGGHASFLLAYGTQLGDARVGTAA